MKYIYVFIFGVLIGAICFKTYTLKSVKETVAVESKESSKIEKEKVSISNNVTNTKEIVTEKFYSKRGKLKKKIVKETTIGAATRNIADSMKSTSNFNTSLSNSETTTKITNRPNILLGFFMRDLNHKNAELVAGYKVFYDVYATVSVNSDLTFKIGVNVLF